MDYLSIVSDRDPVFTSSFWKEPYKLQGITLKHSSAYHPQADGQSEVVNRCLENYFRCFVGSRPKDWARWMSLAEWWYNTSSHSSTGITPYKAVYGNPAARLLSDVKGTTKIQAVEDHLKSRDQIAKILKENLEAAQQRMKRQTDLHRTERSLNAGEWVFLRLQPFRQNSVAMRRNLKLSPRYYRSYEILQKVGQDAYRLDLSPGSKIHPVFHVSQLKKKLGQLDTPQTFLPHVTAEGIVEAMPEES